MKSIENGHLKKSLLLFFEFTFLGCLVLGVIGSAFYWLQMESYYTGLREREKHAVNLQKWVIGDEFKTVIGDLLFLAGQNELERILETHPLKCGEDIESEYLDLLSHKREYDQIRYLDESGMEILRVDQNDGHPAAVAKSALQNKSKRYYFTDSLKLQRGEVYISPMDLNIEQGEIERPLKPMIRFGTPVFDASGVKRGVLLINYLARSLLDTIAQSADPEQGVPMLLNNEGYWLLGDKEENEWGFMLDERADRNFPRDYPEEWRGMLASQPGQLETENGVFTFVKIHPLQENSQPRYFWFLVSQVTAEKMREFGNQLLYRMLGFGGILLVPLCIGAWIPASAIVRRRIYQNRLVTLAYYDALTGLPNRKLFFERLDAGVEHAKRHSRRLGLLFIDLDGFKNVNDTMGHQAGDELLVEVAKVLRATSRRSDTVARLGGDEFAVILSEIGAPDDSMAAGNKIIAELSRPLKLSAGTTTIGASIGAASFPEDAADMEYLIRKADLAMYQSKAKGKNTCTSASSVME